MHQIRFRLGLDPPKTPLDLRAILLREWREGRTGGKGKGEDMVEQGRGR